MVNILICILLLFIVGNSALFEGDDCVVIHLNNSLEAGKCSNIDQCSYAKKLLYENKRPQACGFNRYNPLVCCPVALKETLRLFGSKAEKKCSEYYSPKSVITSVSRGQKAHPHEFPHMVAVGYGHKNNTSWLCGGSLISEEYVLTAAHCATSSNLGPPKWVRLGDLNLNDTSEDSAPQDIAIAKIHIHPNYSWPSHYNDVALLKLEYQARFSLYVQPACLQTKKVLTTSKLEIIGWGKTNFLGEMSSHLLKATLKVVPHEKCIESYASTSQRRLRNGIVDELQICAGGSSGEDSCPGDSGGPLHYLSSGSRKFIDHFVIVGVTSFGKACGMETTVGVYTRVSSYIPWIESIVWPSSK